MRADGVRSPDRRISERLKTVESEVRSSWTEAVDQLDISKRRAEQTQRREEAALKQEALDDISAKWVHFEEKIAENNRQLRVLQEAQQSKQFFKPTATQFDTLYQKRVDIIEGRVPLSSSKQLTLTETIENMRANGANEHNIRDVLLIAEQKTRANYALMKEQASEEMTQALEANQHEKAEAKQALLMHIAKRAGNFEALLRENDKQLGLIDNQGDIFHTPTMQYDGVYHARVKIIEEKQPSRRQTQANITPI